MKNSLVSNLLYVTFSLAVIWAPDLNGVLQQAAEVSGYGSHQHDDIKSGYGSHQHDDIKSGYGSHQHDDIKSGYGSH